MPDVSHAQEPLSQSAGYQLRLTSRPVGRDKNENVYICISVFVYLFICLLVCLLSSVYVYFHFCVYVYLCSMQKSVPKLTSRSASRDKNADLLMIS